MAKILIVDDDRTMRSLLSSLVKRMGHEYDDAETLSEGLNKARESSYDVIFLDVAMPDGNGLDILPQIKETASSPEIIIITGFANSDGAELAIKYGAWDYIEKGSDIETIKLPFLRALQYREEKQKLNRDKIILDREGIIGNSTSIKQCLNQMADAANSDIDVLITGESGTGKELFAWAIHNNSKRCEKNFVTIDCTSLPETLVESMLFGHEKGSFTGADSKRIGLIARAHGGTLFLDEVGELSAELQKSFLRVLQEHRYRPVGSNKELDCDFRLISATNRDLDTMVDQGEFRKDLFFRLQSFDLHLPPLRDRKEDIKLIVMHHLSKLSEQTGIESKLFSSEFFDTLMAYDWPGNIRELNHAIEKAFFTSFNESRLYPQHLPDNIRIAVKKKTFESTQTIDLSAPQFDHINKPLSEFSNMSEFKDAMEAEYLRYILKICNGDINEVCNISGLSRSGVYRLLHKHHLIASKF